MRKNYLRVIYVLPIYLIFIISACSDPGTTPTSGHTTNPPTIQIDNITPSIIPSVARDSFDITVKGYDIGPAFKVHLEVRSHASNSCLAYVDSTNWLSQNTTNFTKKIRTDSLLSSCITQNSLLRIAVWFLDSLNNIHRDSVYYQWGTPPYMNAKSVTVERWRMNSNSRAFCDTMGKCIIRTFDPPDSNYLKIAVSFDSLHIAKDTNFIVYSEAGLTSACEQFSQDNDSDGTVYNKIIYARLQTWNLNIGGWSQWQKTYPPNSNNDNWSFVFMKNIDSLNPSSGTRNDTTVANQSAAHEMLHQLGAIGNRGHTFHTGYFAYKCVLWNGDEHFASEFSNHTYSNRFRICMQHTVELRTFMNTIPMDNTNGNVIFTHFNDNYFPPMNAGQSNVDNKYTISMSVSKNEYKKYEPVMAKFTLVNHDSKPMDIYNLFENTSGEPDFVLKDKNGNVYTHSVRVHNFLSNVRTRIGVGDTLVFTMPLNNWGKETDYQSSLKLDDVYFDQFGYFPPGDYTAYFYFNDEMKDRYNTSLSSNEVSFKVSELSSDDQEILRLYKQGNYNEIINKYPNNPFTEHVWEWKLLPYWIGVNDNTESEYNQFINKYPNSYYMQLWRFMLPYVLSAQKSKGDFNRGVDYLLQQSAGNSVSQVLTNKSFITILKYYGKTLEELKN